MKRYKQLFLSVASSVLLLGSVCAQAADDEQIGEFSSKIASGENVVLFKVHDIKSLKNEDGVVTDCEFGLTFYNRSPKSIDAATIRLSWTDNGIVSVIEAEDKQAAEEDEKNKMEIESGLAASKAVLQGGNGLPPVPQPKTEDMVSKSLSTTVALPQIKPFRQVSLKSKLKSDRCFLMMEQTDFSFTKCNISTPEKTGGAIALSGGREVGGECEQLFRFVSPRDPEYYREFQKVSFNEEAEKRQEALKKDNKEMQETYDRMMENLTQADELLQTFK